MAENKSILPGNLPALEHALEKQEERVTGLDIPIERLWNPETCPEPALPYLAWALSVDVWDPDWSTELKRQVIAAAPELHRIKGTPKAVKYALTALNLDYVYLEWHEQIPLGDPATFDIDVRISEQGISESLVNTIHRTIKANKRATAHYKLSLVLGSEVEQIMSVACVGARTGIVEPYAIRLLSSETDINFNCGTITVKTGIVEAIAL